MTHWDEIPNVALGSGSVIVFTGGGGVAKTGFVKIGVITSDTVLPVVWVSAVSLQDEIVRQPLINITASVI